MTSWLWQGEERYSRLLFILFQGCCSVWACSFVELLVSACQQRRPTESLQWGNRVESDDTCEGGGARTCELAYRPGCQPGSASRKLQGLSGAHSEGPAQRAGAQEKPEPAGEVKEGLSLRLSQKWLFLKEATVRVCALLWWPHLLTAVWSIFTHNVLTGRSRPLLPVTAYNLELELIILIDWSVKENNIPEQLPVIDWNRNTFIDSCRAVLHAVHVREHS